MSVLIPPVNPTLGRLIQTSVYMDTANLCYDMTETLREFPRPLVRFEDWARGHYRPQASR